MKPLLDEIRHNKLLWLLVFVPVVFAAEQFAHDEPTLLFGLSVLAIVPLAALLSHATESVAAKTGDSFGGLLNATLGNLTELVIALTALRAGQYVLVKASLAGAIVTNTLFMRQTGTDGGDTPGTRVVVRLARPSHLRKPSGHGRLLESRHRAPTGSPEQAAGCL